MKTSKNKERKIFSCFDQIISTYFPGEAKKQKNAIKENPKLMGEYFATQALKQLNLS